ASTQSRWWSAPGPAPLANARPQYSQNESVCPRSPPHEGQKRGIFALLTPLLQTSSSQCAYERKAPARHESCPVGCSLASSQSPGSTALNHEASYADAKYAP